MNENQSSEVAAKNTDVAKGITGRFLYFLCWSLSRLVLILYNRTSVSGRGKIPPEGPCLLIANHASNLDPVIVATSFNRRLRFMAKKELFDVPGLGWLIRHLGSYPVQRGTADRSAFRATIELLREGEAILIFPEGTRTHDGSLQAFNPGVAILALSTPGVAVLPIYIDGSYRALGRGVPFPRPNRIRVRVGDPFPADALPGLPQDGAARRKALIDHAREQVVKLQQAD